MLSQKINPELTTEQNQLEMSMGNRTHAGILGVNSPFSHPPTRGSSEIAKLAGEVVK